MKTIIREEIVYLREAVVEGDLEDADEIYEVYGDDGLRWSDAKETRRCVQFEDECGEETEWVDCWNY